MSAVNHPVSGRRRHESLIRSFEDRVVVDGEPKFRRPVRLPVPTALAHNEWMHIVFMEFESD